MATIWDPETQEIHGGQSWRSCPNFISDFSVTTNAFGPPPSALQAAQDSLVHIDHYPAADALDATKALAKFTSWPSSQLLVGNGASEFIDLVMKALPPGPFKPGPYIAAYREYNRAARAADREILSPDSNLCATVSVIIHPNSPTGDCMSIDKLRQYISSNSDTYFVIDESFMPFYGSEWRKYSALDLINEFPQRVLVIASWTKLWSCPGLRLGTISASKEWIKLIKSLQTPWSCNTAAQAFAVAAVSDTDYLNTTWECLPKWKRSTIEHIHRLGWSPNKQSPDWVPWIFVYIGDKRIASKAVEIAHKVGCPIRPCTSFNLDEHIRIGIRRPEHQKILFNAWEKEFGLASNGLNGNTNHAENERITVLNGY